MGPDVPDLDQDLARLRREKEAAIDAQDFETAAALRDKEKRLLAGQASRDKSEAAGTSSLAEDIARLSAELDRLRGMLRERGIEPGDGAA